MSASLICHVIYHRELRAKPRGSSAVWPERGSADVTFHGDLVISALRSVSHTPLRDGGGQKRSGAAWHPTRTGCGAEAASDNTSC